MAGLAAGVVAAGDINAQPAQTGGMSLSEPAAWSTIWFAVSFLYLVGIYFGMIKLHKK